MLNSISKLTTVQYNIFEDIANELPDLVIDEETEQILINQRLIIVNEVLLHFDINKPPKLTKNYIVPGPVKLEWDSHVVQEN